MILSPPSSFKPSGACLACIPCADLASEFHDVSGNMCHFSVDPANTGAFGTPGFASSIAGTAAGCSIPSVQFAGFDFTKNSFMLQFTLDEAAPVANQTILSFGASQANSVYNGFLLSLRTSGKIQLEQCVSDALFAVTATNEIVVANSTPMIYQLWYDAPSGSAWAYVNTVLSGAWPAAFTANGPSGAHAFGATAPIYHEPTLGHSVGVRLGGGCHYTDTTVAVGIQNFHLYTFNGDLPVNIGTLNRKLFDNPNTPLLANDFIYPVTKEYWLMLGQSNEAGVGAGASGNIYRCRNEADGCPIDDPVWPNSVASGSGLAKISAVLGSKNGRWLQWKNYAIGTTALTQFWVGSVTLYSASMLVVPGAYIKSVANGNIYKAIGTAGNSYTLNVDPASGVGSSGLSSWTLQTSVLSFEVPGYIYSSTDGTGRFDPNNQLAPMLTNLAVTVGYSIKGVYVQIGQGDAAALATSAMYSQAMINVANYFTASGYRVKLGMTFDASTTNAWNTAQLLPGCAAALAALASNPLVSAGANLCSLFGDGYPQDAVAQPTAMGNAPGYIQNTVNGSPVYIHVNDKFWSIAAQAIAATM